MEYKDGKNTTALQAFSNFEYWHILWGKSKEYLPLLRYLLFHLNVEDNPLYLQNKLMSLKYMQEIRVISSISNTKT